MRVSGGFGALRASRWGGLNVAPRYNRKLRLTPAGFRGIIVFVAGDCPAARRCLVEKLRPARSKQASDLHSKAPTLEEKMSQSFDMMILNFSDDQMHGVATALANAEQAGYEGKPLAINPDWSDDLRLAAKTVHREGLNARTVEASWDADILADCNGADDRVLNIR